MAGLKIEGVETFVWAEIVRQEMRVSVETRVLSSPTSW